MCPNCQGTSNNYNITYSYAGNCQPSDCGGTQLSSKCVYYSGPNLSCSGINTNDSVELALQKIDTKLCSVVADYSTYQMNCLPTYFGAPITTQADFVNAITSYACLTNTNLQTFINTTFTNYQSSVNTRFTNIEVPGITCSGSNVLPTDSLQTVLNKYCTTLTNIQSDLSLVGVTNWNQCFTVGTPPTNVTSAITLLINQLCQVKAGSGGALPTFNNIGTCLPTPGASDTLVSTISQIITRLCQTPTFDINALSWGNITKPSSTTTDLQNAFQTVLTNTNNLVTQILNSFSSDFIVTQVDPLNPLAGKKLSLATPLNQDKYVAATPSDPTPGTLQDKLIAGTGIVLDYTSTPNKLTISATGFTNIQSTATVNVIGNGTSVSPLQTNVKISSSGGNMLVQNSDGLYVPSAQPTTLNFIESSTTKPTVSGADVSFAVKIDTSQTNNILQYTTNGLFVPQQSSNTQTITGTATNTLTLSASADSNYNYTINGNVKVASSVGTNAIKIATDGLYVAISQQSGNNLVLNSDGLFASVGSSQVNSDWNATTGVAQILNKPTFNNGLTYTGGTPATVQLGGTLLKNTIIDGTSGGYSLTMLSQSTALNTNAYGIVSSFTTNIVGAETTQIVCTPFYSAFGVQPGATGFTPNTNSKHGAFSGTVYCSGSSSWAGMIPVFWGGLEFSSSINVNHAVVFRAFFPRQQGGQPTYTGTVTNATGLYIDSMAGSEIVSSITNRYGIYQAGVGEKNLFYGTVQTSSGSVTAISDIRMKTNIEPYNRGLKEIEQISTKMFEYKYNLGKRVVGVIAQELEQIIPELVTVDTFTTNDDVVYKDFRTVDTTGIMFTLVNAVKELSQRVKSLEQVK